MCWSHSDQLLVHTCDESMSFICSQSCSWVRATRKLKLENKTLIGYCTSHSFFYMYCGEKSSISNVLKPQLAARSSFQVSVDNGVAGALSNRIYNTECWKPSVLRRACHQVCSLYCPLYVEAVKKVAAYVLGITLPFEESHFADMMRIYPSCRQTFYVALKCSSLASIHPEDTAHHSHV